MNKASKRIAAVFAVATILAVFIWLTPHEQTVTRENFGRVLTGMTFEEVRTILGEPESIELVAQEELYRSGIIRWVSRPRHFFDVCAPYIEVHFEKYAVTHKQFPRIAFSP